MPVFLEGNGRTEQEASARTKTTPELAEIAYRNDYPPALIARAELARRNEKDGKRNHLLAVVGCVSGILGTLVAIIALVVSLKH